LTTDVGTCVVCKIRNYLNCAIIIVYLPYLPNTNTNPKHDQSAFLTYV